MLAFIALFFPAVIMVVWKRRLFKEDYDWKAMLMEYIAGIVLINFLVIAIAYVFFESEKGVVSNINMYNGFALKYLALAMVLVFIIPFAGKWLITKINSVTEKFEDCGIKGIQKFGYICTYYVQRVCRRIVDKCGGKKQFVQNLLITLLLAIILFVGGSFKSGFHVDEMYTFGLSNHQYSLNNSIVMNISDGNIYDGEDVWNEYLTTLDGGKFDYGNVFINQTHDVHPPLYYVLIHTVSSLFSFLPIVIIALLVHVPLACIVFWQMVWIEKKLGVKRNISLILSFLFVIGMGFFNYAVVFFRMYDLLTVWINSLIIIFLNYPARDKGNYKYYISFGLVLLGGLLTQYYFIIYACFVCLTYAVFVIAHKNWGKFISSVIVVFLAAFAWLKIFPAAWDHIFNTYRGTEAVENFSSGNLAENFGTYIKLINSNIFGNLLIYIIAAILCLTVIALFLSKEESKTGMIEKLCPYFLTVLPFVAYVLVVSKIAPYNTMRYVISVSGIFYLAVMAALVNLVTRINIKADVIICILAFIIVVRGYYINGCPMLYSEETERIEALNGYEDSLCVYIYDARWKILPNLVELKNMNTIVFMNGANWESLNETNSNEESMIVYISNYLEVDHEDILNSLERSYGLSTSDELFSFGYVTAYLID